MMSLGRRGSASDAPVPRLLASKKFKFSKKPKKERTVQMSDLPPDAPPVECPLSYEYYLTMKTQKMHRLSISKRYIGKIERGMLRLTPEKTAKTINDAIGPEYSIDLSAAAIICDDARRRLIFKFKNESRRIGPVNRDEYETFKEVIDKHRKYRQSVKRQQKDEGVKKDDGFELLGASSVQTGGVNPQISNNRPILMSAEQDSDRMAKPNRDDLRAVTMELSEKVAKIAADIKIISYEVKQMHFDLKELMKAVQFNKELKDEKSFSIPGAQKLSSEEDSVSVTEDAESNKLDEFTETAQQQIAEITKEGIKELIKDDRKGYFTDHCLLDHLFLLGVIDAANNLSLFVVAVKRSKTKILSAEEIKEEKVELTEAEKLQPRRRRDQLPKPSIPGEELGLRQLMAIVARRMVVPISFFEPLSLLQVITEELRYSGQTLSRAAAATDPADRIAYVTAFAVSGYAGMIGRKQKPFNPLLGETFEFISNEGWKYHAEQVSHHPPISAAHAESMNWVWWQTLSSTSRTSWNGTLEFTTEFPVRVRLCKEDYCWNKVKIVIENASSLPELRRFRLDGTMNIRCSNGYTSSVVFRKDRQTEVSGSIMDNRGILAVKLFGYYDRFLQKANQKDYLFEAIPLPKNSAQYYGFSQFACGLNEFLLDEKMNAPPTDSRNRPDIKALENADANRANEAKMNLEKAQRARNEATHKRMWFEQKQDPMTNTMLWVSNGQYWQAREKKFKGYPDMIQLFWLVNISLKY